MLQKEALDILKMGHNVYLTGAAGSGKTYVLNEFIKYLKKNNIVVGVTASTGIAATHMNGMTIHSWAGMGITEIGPQDIQRLLCIDKTQPGCNLLPIRILTRPLMILTLDQHRS